MSSLVDEDPLEQARRQETIGQPFGIREPITAICVGSRAVR